MKKMSFSGKYIAKMFSLTKFGWFVLVRVVRNQRYVSRNVFSEKSLNRLVLYGLSSRYFNYNA